MKAKVDTKKNKVKEKEKTVRVSYNKKPDNLTMDQWQFELRKQYAASVVFKYKNIGNHLVFSDYTIKSSDSAKFYKVSIRSQEGMNYCECMDFKTNNLGTCKHIEHILFNINEKPKLQKIFQKGYPLTYSSVYLDYKGERKVRLRVGTENSIEITTLAAIYFDQHGILEEDAYNQFEQFLQKVQKLNSGFRCYPDALEFILTKRENNARFEKVQKELKNPKFLKSLLRADLFPYQKQGIEFALKAGRAMIADDMGLGKTIQAIGVAEGLKKISSISKVLIVCPTSLKYQWKTEIEKFTDSSIQVIEGNIFQRKALYANDTFYKICSYNVVGRDIETINLNDFDLVILDEAQRIKNWQTQTAKNVKKIQSKYAVVLTGTPIENKLEELYSLVQMIDPFKMGALFRFLNEHQITDESTGKIKGYKDLNGIAVLLKNNMIRRHKRDVLKDLPERMDKNLFVPMTKEQTEVHLEAYDAVARIASKWVRFGFLSEKDRQNLLINLNRMRMVCDSTFIIDQTTRFDTKVDELMNILEEVFENGDEKVVIFSQWERMTRLVGWELEKRKVKFESLHGGVHSKDREKLFSNFNNDPESKVFLSTDAGGVGLNLQAGSILINLDLPWNPAVLEQRIARIHRMGQKRKVQIINFVSQGTIEEDMLNRLSFKSALASGVLDNGEDAIFMEESKFSAMMKEIAELTAKASAQEFVQTQEEKEIHDFEKPIDTIEDVKLTESSDDLETNENNKKETTGGEKESYSKSLQLPLFEDEPETIEIPSTNSDDLVSIGTNFFGKLMETLSSKEKTQELVQTIVKTDEKTGETYLKIPVKNQEMIENGLKLLGKFFGN